MQQRIPIHRNCSDPKQWVSPLCCWSASQNQAAQLQQFRGFTQPGMWQIGCTFAVLLAAISPDSILFWLPHLSVPQATRSENHHASLPKLEGYRQKPCLKIYGKPSKSTLNPILWFPILVHIKIAMTWVDRSQFLTPTGPIPSNSEPCSHGHISSVCKLVGLGQIL